MRKIRVFTQTNRKFISVLPISFFKKKTWQINRGFSWYQQNLFTSLNKSRWPQMTWVWVLTTTRYYFSHHRNDRWSVSGRVMSLEHFATIWSNRCSCFRFLNTDPHLSQTCRNPESHHQSSKYIIFIKLYHINRKNT